VGPRSAPSPLGRDAEVDREGTGRGMEPFVLLELAAGPTYGYQLAAAVAGFGFRRAEKDPSVVYKVLRALEARGYVSSGWSVDDVQVKPRRVYRLTESGERYLEERAADLRRHAQRIERLLARYAQLCGVKPSREPASG
jgi:DNA-binding PadR family transcriptional regulator